MAGAEDKLVYSGKTSSISSTNPREPASPHRRTRRCPGAGGQDQARSASKSGAAVFANNCQACHQADGEGVPDAFPPLAKSDYLNGDKIRAIKTVTGGLETKLTVNGHVFNGVMPAWSLSDEEIADVLTYVYSTVGQFRRSTSRPPRSRAYRVKAN